MKNDLALEKILQNTFIKILINDFPDENLELTGGAIIDILDGRKPKDWDFKSLIYSQIVKQFDFLYETEFSISYCYKGEIIQFLKDRELPFDFTISNAIFNLKKKALTNYDGECHDKRHLRPNAFTKEASINALRRIPHWQNKGYSINKHTYLSLLSIIIPDKKLKPS